MIRLSLLCLVVFSLGRCASDGASIDVEDARDRDAIRWQTRDALEALDREERELRAQLRGEDQ